MTRLEGQEAIEYAQENGLALNKYADPTEGAREDVTVEEAQSIVRTDPRLVYVDVNG